MVSTWPVMKPAAGAARKSAASAKSHGSAPVTSTYLPEIPFAIRLAPRATATLAEPPGAASQSPALRSAADRP